MPVMHLFPIERLRFFFQYGNFTFAYADFIYCTLLTFNYIVFSYEHICTRNYCRAAN